MVAAVPLLLEGKATSQTADRRLLRDMTIVHVTRMSHRARGILTHPSTSCLACVCKELPLAQGLRLRIVGSKPCLRDPPFVRLPSHSVSTGFVPVANTSFFYLFLDCFVLLLDRVSSILGSLQTSSVAKDDLAVGSFCLHCPSWN